MSTIAVSGTVRVTGAALGLGMGKTGSDTVGVSCSGAGVVTDVTGAALESGSKTKPGMVLAGLLEAGGDACGVVDLAAGVGAFVWGLLVTATVVAGLTGLLRVLRGAAGSTVVVVVFGPSPVRGCGAGVVGLVAAVFRGRTGLRTVGMSDGSDAGRVPFGPFWVVVLGSS